MKTMLGTTFRSSLSALLCLCAAGICLLGCESDDTVTHKNTLHSKSYYPVVERLT